MVQTEIKIDSFQFGTLVRSLDNITKSMEGIKTNLGALCEVIEDKK